MIFVPCACDTNAVAKVNAAASLGDFPNMELAATSEWFSQEISHILECISLKMPRLLYVKC